jgi:hypothetical protein
MTINKWDPDNETEIGELVLPKLTTPEKDSEIKEPVSPELTTSEKENNND